MIDVNLIPDKKKIPIPEQKTRRKFLIVFSISTGISIIILGSLFFYSLYQNNRISNLNNQRAGVLSRLESQKDTAIKLRLTKEKAISIKAIRDSQVDFSSRLTFLRSILPPVTDLKSLAINEDNTASLAIDLASADAFTALLKTLNLNTGSFVFTNVNLTGMKLEASGKVSLNLAGKLNPKNNQ